MAAYRAAHPYASAVEIAEVRAAERGKDPHTVPYFDLTVSAVKSVSVLHASYRTGARQARDRGDEEEAAALDAKAQEIEDALMRVGARSGRLAGSARHLHPHRPPLRHDGGVARRRRPGRRVVPASHQPRRRPAAARPRGDLEPGPARRRGRRQMAHPGLPDAAQPAARRRRHHRPADGDKADRAGVRDGAPRRRQRRRGRRRRPGRDGPVQLPRRRDHRGTQAAGRRVRGQPRQPAEPAHAVAAAPAGRAEHPPQQERRRAAPSPGRPAARNPPTPSGSPRGKPRPPAGKSRHCRRYTGR